MKNIAVLTSGGDAPGMNACIADLYTMASRKGLNLVGVRRGYVGLMEDDFEELTDQTVKYIAGVGGSYLKTARSKEFITIEGRKKAVANLKKHNIDVLVVIGGDGSFRGAQDLHQMGVNVVALPGTIDNDLNYSEKSLGFDTAVTNSVSAIDKIKETMLSNSRGAVIEVMGRRSGDIAMYSAVASSADAVIIKEVPETVDLVVENVKRAIKRGVENPTVIVAEKILDTKELGFKLEETTGKAFRTSVLGYIQRGGTPTVFDKNYAMQLAVKTIELIMEDNVNKAIGVNKGKIFTVPIEEVITKKTNFNFQLYDFFNNLIN